MMKWTFWEKTRKLCQNSENKKFKWIVFLWPVNRMLLRYFHVFPRVIVRWCLITGWECRHCQLRTDIKKPFPPIYQYLIMWIFLLGELGGFFFWKNGSKHSTIYYVWLKIIAFGPKNHFVKMIIGSFQIFRLSQNWDFILCLFLFSVILCGHWPITGLKISFFICDIPNYNNIGMWWDHGILRFIYVSSKLTI